MLSRRLLETSIRDYPVHEDKPLSDNWKVLAREGKSTDMLSNVAECLQYVRLSRII